MRPTKWVNSKKGSGLQMLGREINSAQTASTVRGEVWRIRREVVRYREREREDEPEEPVDGGSAAGGGGGAGEDLWTHPEPDGEAIPPQDPPKEAYWRQGRSVVPLRHQERRPPRHRPRGETVRPPSLAAQFVYVLCDFHDL